LSPSIRYGPGGGATIYKPWWGAAKAKIGAGPANRPRPDERVEDALWEERTALAIEPGRPGPVRMGNERGADWEDETRYWPWMTEMEMEWQPPANAPVVDLMEMAKPNRRKRRHHVFQVLANPTTLDQVLAFGDSPIRDDMSVVELELELESGTFSDYASELGFDYQDAVDAVEWEDVALDLDYVDVDVDADDTREELGIQVGATSVGSGRLTRPRLSYAQALSVPGAQLPPSR